MFMKSLWLPIKDFSTYYDMKSTTFCYIKNTIKIYALATTFSQCATVSPTVEVKFLYLFVQ